MCIKREPITIIRDPIYIVRTPIDSDYTFKDLLKEDVRSYKENAIENDYLDIDEHPSPVLSSLEEAYVMKFPSLYALKYKPIRNKPLTFISTKSPFKNRPWQEGIINDMHPNKIVEKSRQLGLSELNITEVIWFLDTHPGVNVMYTFPRSAQMLDFSRTRVSPVFRDSKYLATLLSRETNTVATKKIGDSFLFMRSSWSGAVGEGVDTDMFVADEYDRMKDGVELAFKEGLKSSRYGLVRRFSTPTIPGRGINNLYQKSDQMRYIHTCPHCGYKQFLTAEDNIIQVKPKGVNNVTQEIEDGTFIIGCKKCKQELDRWSPGEWVATYPSIKETRGYHITQMDATWITADDIMRRKFSYTSKQLFYNYVLGEPYAPTGLLVTEEDIKRSIRLPHEINSRVSEYVAISIGIDWGEVSWLLVLGMKADGRVDLLNIYYVEDSPAQPLKSSNYFCAVMRAYKPNIIVADSGYGSDRNSYMYTQYPASFYSCYWVTSKDSRAKIRFMDVYNEKTREITVDKTVKMQRALHSVKNGLIGMFPWNEKLQLLAKHLQCVRIVDEEDDGVVYQMATRIGGDHLACCLAYALTGLDKLTKFGVSLRTPTEAEFI